METQQDVTDTIAVMEKYNFDKPMNVSIIYDDQEEVPTYHHPHRGEFLLINKISEILVSLKETLVYYCDVIARCQDEKRKDRLKAHWLRVKQKLFNDCVAMSNEFLSQHCVTDRFIGDIISSIEQIAKVPITYNIVSYIHETLLKWMELKQFQVTHALSDQSKNYSTLAQPLHPYAHFSPGNVVNMAATNIIPSGSSRNQFTLEADPRIPVQCRNDWNIANSTLPSTPYIKEGVGTHHIPHSNHCFNVVNDQQIPIPNAPTLSSVICYTEPQLNNPERVCYNYTQINSNNAILTQSNQINSDEISRNTISRDSGFISPVTSVSPSEYEYHTVHHPFVLYEQRTSNFPMPPVPTIGLNMINNARPK